MAVKLHKAGFDHAMAMIQDGLEVEHDSNNWLQVQPTRDEIVHYLDTHTLEEYGLWFLGIDTDVDSKSSDKFKYPYGDFSVLHQSGLVAIEKDATMANNHDVKAAAQKLLTMLKNNPRK